MTKNEFLSALEKRLSGLPKEDMERSIEFYAEMIDDRMDDGMSEEEAVSALGDMENIVSEILNEIPLTKIIKKRMAPSRKLKTWEIVLLILGAPLWLPLVIVAACLVLVLYLVIWVVVICIYVLNLALFAGSLGFIAFGVYGIIGGNILKGIFYIGLGITSLGLGLFCLLLSKVATKGAIAVGKGLWLCIKRLFMRKEKNDD